MPSVELSSEEWQQVMNILIQSHPLLMKIAGQLREQVDADADKVKRDGGIKLDANGREVRG